MNKLRVSALLLAGTVAASSLSAPLCAGRGHDQPERGAVRKGRDQELGVHG